MSKQTDEADVLIRVAEQADYKWYWNSVAQFQYYDWRKTDLKT